MVFILFGMSLSIEARQSMLWEYATLMLLEGILYKSTISCFAVCFDVDNLAIIISLSACFE